MTNLETELRRYLSKVSKAKTSFLLLTVKREMREKLKEELL